MGTWTAANVIALAVAICGAAVSIGVLLQKVTQLQLELAKLEGKVEAALGRLGIRCDDLKEAIEETRTRQGRRLGRIEGWINGSEAMREGRPPSLQSARHDTRGIPIPLPGQDSEKEET